MAKTERGSQGGFPRRDLVDYEHFTHLWGTALSPTAMDQVFADAVATGVRRGRMWSPNRGTAASAQDCAVLAERPWEISF